MSKEFTSRKFTHPQGHTKVDNRVFYLQEVLSPISFGVLIRIYRMTEGYDGLPKPMSNTYLQTLCNITKNTVTKAIKELEGLKLIIVQRKSREVTLYSLNVKEIDSKYREICSKCNDTKDNTSVEVTRNEQKDNKQKDTIPFDVFWNSYDKKTDKAKCENIWNKLTKDEQEKVMNHVPAYVSSTPDKTFRKHPYNYLINKNYLDEIVAPNSTMGYNSGTNNNTGGSGYVAQVRTPPIETPPKVIPNKEAPTRETPPVISEDFNAVIEQFLNRNGSKGTHYVK